MFNIDQKINIRFWYARFGISHIYHLDMKEPKSILWKLGNLIGRNYSLYIKGEALHGNKNEQRLSSIFRSSW